MIKVLTFIKRKPGITREEFLKYYEEVHAPLSLKHLPKPARYVRNHIIAAVEGQEPEFDCVTEHWFETVEDAMAVNEVMGGSDAATGYTTEVGKIFLEDEGRFMDRASRFACMVDERVSGL